MESFDYSIIEETAKELYIRALCDLPSDVRSAIRAAAERETDPTARTVFETILENITIADRDRTLICQDSGLPVFLVSIGSAYPWNGAEITKRLRTGSERATLEFPFRGSSTHPLTRKNPGNSTGERLPVCYFDFIDGSDRLEIHMMPKGSGSENMSSMRMFTPAEGLAAIKRFVVEAVFKAVTNVYWEHLHPEALYEFSVERFGPLIVAMDSHGARLYEQVRHEATERLPEICRSIGASEK